MNDRERIDYAVACHAFWKKQRKAAGFCLVCMGLGAVGGLLLSLIHSRAFIFEVILNIGGFLYVRAKLYNFAMFRERLCERRLERAMRIILDPENKQHYLDRHD